MTSFETCSVLYNDPSSQLKELLECISTTESESRADLAAGLDAFFLIFAGAMVFFMQTGFAMLCAGSIRAKNVKNVILWNLLDSAGGGLAFWAVGYAFAYGGDGEEGTDKTFIGNRGFFLQNEEIRLENWLFQFAFACALSSIVAGTIAERMQMRAYLMYSVFLAGFVYPVVAHSFWSTKGFLSSFAAEPLWNAGIIDFAGSGAVHMAGGVTALVAAVILGPRIGRFYDRDGNLLAEPAEFAPHSVTLQMLGTFCLWFGWYGFNPGSILLVSSANNGGVAALAAVNTTLSACAGAVSAMFTSTIWDYFFLGYHTYDVTLTMNGCLTGLVAITSPCATVDTWAAVVIGIIAGWVYMFSSKLMIKLRIDDAVDAIPVHMFGGMWGLLAAGLFTKPELLINAYGDAKTHAGWFYDGSDFTLAGTQLIGILWVFGWVGIIMGLFFYFLSIMGWLRIDPLEEEVGMDISRHKGAAYDIKPANEADVKQLHNSRHGGGKIEIEPEVAVKKMAEPDEVDA